MTLPDSRRRVAAAGAVTLACGAAYWATLGAGPFWQDAGLFIGGLKLGGGLAPPGYPLYLILGRPFVALFQALAPGRPFAEAANAFSALWAALGAGLTTLSVLLLATPGFTFFQPPGERAPGRPSAAGFAAAILAGLMAGLSYSLWSQALTAEAYALNAFFAAWLLYLVLRLGAEGPLGARPSGTQRRLLVLLFVVHGLSCGNHPSTVIFVPLLAWLAWTQRAAFADRRLVAAVFAAYAASGLLPYLYLPFAARAYPATLYGDVTTLSGLIAHVSGSQWTAQEQSYGWAPDRLGEFPLQLWRELFAVGLLGLALGLARVLKRERRLAALLGLFLPVAWLVPMAYLQGGEYDYWFLPLYMTLFALAGAGLAGLFERVAGAGRPLALRVAVPGLAAVAALLPALSVNLPLVDRRRDFVPEDFARNLYRHVATNGVLLASSDQECSLSFYLEAVENPRPDVARVDSQLLGLPWYLRYLKARYPALAVPEPQEELALAEDLLAALIRANPARAFYISKRPSFAPPEGQRWVPAGSLWRLGGGLPQDVDPRDWDVVYRNPRPFDRPARAHAPQKLDPSGASGLTAVVREPYTHQIRRFHMQGFKNLGDWQLERGRYPEAVSAYEGLLALQPGFDHPGIQFAYGKALFAAGRNDEALAVFGRLEGRLDAGTSAEAYLYVAQIHATGGRRQKAGEYFRAVRRLAPDLWKQNEAALRASGMLDPGAP